MAALAEGDRLALHVRALIALLERAVVVEAPEEAPVLAFGFPTFLGRVVILDLQDPSGPAWHIGSVVVDGKNCASYSVSSTAVRTFFI